MSDVKQKSSRQRLGAVPVEPGKFNSPWLTAPADALLGINKIISKSDYIAHAGVYSGGLNGCFWIRILEKLPNGNLLIENLYDVGKIKVECVQAVIEPDLVYPLIRGYGVHRWHTSPNAHIILTQDPLTRTGISLADMRRKYPKTYAYLLHFEEQLKQRASSSVQKLMEDGKFYSMFSVGSYTLAPIRVFWRQFLPDLRMTVYAEQKHEYVGNKVALTQHVVSSASFDTLDEAYYFAACGNSGPVQLLHWNSSTSKSYGTPSILDIIGIPRYKVDNRLHCELAVLSKRCHESVVQGDLDTINNYEAQIDELAAQMWNITSEELAAIHEALAEMKAKRPILPSNEIEEDAPQLNMEM